MNGSVQRAELFRGRQDSTQEPPRYASAPTGEPGERAFQAGLVIAEDPNISDETKIGIAAGALFVGTAPVVVAGAEVAGASAAAGAKAVQSALKNVSFDGPSPGLRRGEGRIFGVRWKGSQSGIRLDLHSLGRGSNARRVLHINFGSPYGKEGTHVPLFDPNWFKLDQ